MTSIRAWARASGRRLTCCKSSTARTQVLASTVALLGFGMLGAGLGGASLLRGGLRVVIGGWLAMGITYGFGRAFGIAGGTL
jgi:VIT1/CCC1 family predicted Fe2+/Mn2+ transporter